MSKKLKSKDYKIDIDLLSEICETPGAPGHEQRIREVVLREVKPLVDEFSIDNMGNVLAVKKGKKKKKVMVTAHMDEISFIVRHIDENGFLKFLPLGGFDPKTLTAQRVIVHGKKDIIGVMGCKPIHLMKASERGKNLELRDFYIDTGLTKEEVEEIVYVGATVTRERKLIQMGQCINCKSLDNRLSVYILIETLRELKKSRKKLPYDLVAAFTVQEEVGIRGAMTAALSTDADFGINLDVTIAFDLPGAKPEDVTTSLGKGTAIKVMDSSIICDYRMVKFMKETADKSKITWQPELLAGGGTDSAGIQRMTPNGGAVVGALSIPTRHIHQVIEMAHKADVRDTIDLLKACLLEIDDYDWSFK